MSWSFSCIGKPENVADALQSHGQTIVGDQSRLEFYTALPHLLALVQQNFVVPGSGYGAPTLDVDFCGCGTEHGGVQVHRNCMVSIKLCNRPIV